MYPDPGASRIIVSMQLTLLLLAILAAPTLPSDPRLEPVRAELAQVVDQTSQAGLPADVLVAKVQEGLAKNVPPPRIVRGRPRSRQSSSVAMTSSLLCGKTTACGTTR